MVRQIQVDLRNTEIRSPVSGVIIQRNVELGQTVAASLQSPTLFLIADDLRQMEIAANIDEADIGLIRIGQNVSFTVSAYPGRKFIGHVKQVRLSSQTVQNVVIYTAIISIQNYDHELMPGSAESAARASLPPLIAERCLRMVLISAMGAPECTSTR